MRERHFSRLAVINRAASQISADRNAEHQRRRKLSVRSPAQRRQFVSELHHRRPDVIEELNFDTGFIPTIAMPLARPTIDASAIGVLKHRELPNSACRPAVSLKTPPLPLTSLQMTFPAAIGNVFAKHDNAVVPPHLFAQRQVDQVRHDARFALGLRRHVELSDVGSTVSEYKWRITVSGSRRRGFQCALRVFQNSAIDLAGDPFEFVRVQNSLLQQKCRKRHQRIALQLLPRVRASFCKTRSSSLSECE